jgi:hypothetical protein
MDDKFRYNKPHCPIVSNRQATYRSANIYLTILLQQFICYFQSEWCVDDAKAQQTIPHCQMRAAALLLLLYYSPYMKM